MKLRSKYGFIGALTLGVLALPHAALAESRTHDGFFFQASLGFGPGWISEELKSESLDLSEEFDFSGVTGMFELKAGGTPAPGFVLGGALTGHSVVNPTMEYQGQELETEDTSIGVSQISLFANWYPQPSNGFYVHGSVGYGAASVTVDDVTRDTNTSGIVLGVGAGYDFWIADEWSLGPQLRLTYAHLTGEEDGVEGTDNFISPTLSFTATFH